MTDSSTEPRPARWAPRFFAIWTGQAFSLLGSMLVQFALVWWLTQTTGSATVLAMATLVAVLPGIVIGPFAGALVDRWNRRLIMIVADSLIALVTLGLIFLYATGRMEVWHVYVAMFLRAALGGFHWPAMQSSTSLMVPKEHLARVAGLNQTMINVTHIPGVRQGDEVVLIGRQGDDRITAEEVAERLGTINYEVVSAILARVPRETLA